MHMSVGQANGFLDPSRKSVSLKKPRAPIDLIRNSAAGITVYRLAHLQGGRTSRVQQQLPFSPFPAVSIPSDWPPNGALCNELGTSAAWVGNPAPLTTFSVARCRNPERSAARMQSTVNLKFHQPDI